MRRTRAVLEAALFGGATLAVAGFDPRGALAGLLVAVVGYVLRARRTREVARIRGGVADAADGRRPRLEARVSPETEEVFAALERFAGLVAAERDGSEKARVVTRTVFDEVPVGLVVVDFSLAVLDANPAARRLFGVPPTARLHALVDLVRDPSVTALFRGVLGGAEEEEAPHTLVRLGVEGAERLLEVTVRAIPGRHLPSEAAALAVARDVTERERLEAMRRRFVADVSHELRTPIATLRAAGETLAGEEGLSPDGLRLVEIVQRQAAEMQDLVSDLTDLAQIESGTVTLVVDVVNLKALLSEVVADLARPAELRRVEVALDAPAEAWVQGDRRRLAQVFRNLVDNAVKFSSPAGRVDVLAEVVDSREGETVVVHVVDRGLGIPRSEQTKIFQRFYRVDPSRTKAVPGTGLGLAIVKHLLILHGGSIRVESEPRRGSRFSVTLPAAREGAGVFQEAS